MGAVLAATQQISENKCDGAGGLLGVRWEGLGWAYCDTIFLEMVGEERGELVVDGGAHSRLCTANPAHRTRMRHHSAIYPQPRAMSSFTFGD